MPVILQPPKRLRRKLYRYEHFHFNTNLAPHVPRYTATDPAGAADKLAIANEEASISISLNAINPAEDMVTRNSARTSIWVNGNSYSVDDTTSTNLIRNVAQSNNSVTTEIPVWYSNYTHFDTPNFFATKIYFAPQYKALKGHQQANDMREPYGLSEYMQFYNKVSTYGKKFRITFTPHWMPGLAGTGTAAESIVNNQLFNGTRPQRDIFGNINEQNYYNGSSHYIPGDQKFLFGAYGATKPEHQGNYPIWKYEKNRLSRRTDRSCKGNR